MIKKYLVKLTPHDQYFFGGENTFGNSNVNYFVKSNYFPQQTGLLGFVRHQLLLQSNNGTFSNKDIIDNDKAIGLIGEKSFRLGEGFNFGAIKSISPVFIANGNGNYLFPANKEYQWYTDKNGDEIKKMRQIIFHANGKSNLHNEKIPELLEYEAKEELPDLFIDNKLYLYRYSDVFYEQQQVGIRKNYKGKSDDKAYYIQTYYGLLPGYSFAFILELNSEVNFTTQDLVMFGGEQSKFKMQVSEFKDEFKSLIPEYEKSINTAKVVLVSDSYASNDILKVCSFALTETVDFRFLKSSVEHSNKYSDLSKTKIGALDKSGKYNLFKKGSVFYGNHDDISKYLNDDSLNKLGYNIFKPVKQKQ